MCSISEELSALRRHFHAHPELSLEEYGTADFIENYLRGLGLSPVRVGETGIMATVPAGRPGCKTAAIRAELDAIPVEEKLDVPWKSRNLGVMHACGHDGILAVALVLARLCSESRETLPVNVKFLFQPAEENGKGTKLMLDAGAMEDADYFLMYHFVNDAPAGMELQYVPSSATIGSVEISIEGKASHWCTKELGIDAIGAAGKVLGIIEELNRTYSAEGPFVLGIGTISGGTVKNVIAERTSMEGTLRACSAKDYFRLRSLLLKKLEQLEGSSGCRILARVEDKPIPPIVNDKAMVDLAAETGREIWGQECRITDKQFLSGDSAAFYFDHAKGIFCIFTAAKSGEENYPLHNGRFDFEESVMEKAVRFLLEYIRRLPLSCAN